MNTREQILAEIERYIAKAGISAREFGIAVRGDTGLVYRMRKGMGLTMRGVDQCRAYMRDNPPSKKKRQADEPRTAA